MSMLSEEKNRASYDFPAVFLGVSEVGYANASTLTGAPKHAGFGAALVVFFFFRCMVGLPTQYSKHLNKDHLTYCNVWPHCGWSLMVIILI